MIGSRRRGIPPTLCGGVTVKPFSRYSVAVLLSVTLCPTWAAADRCVDQGYDPGQIRDLSGVVNRGLIEAQTFTVGMTGTLLRVDVMVGRDPEFAPGKQARDLEVEIRRTADGLPTNTLLASVRVEPGDIPVVPDPPLNPGFLEVDFSARGLRVTAGEVLAIALRCPACLEHPSGPYLWMVSRNNPYPRGRFAHRPAGGLWVPHENDDAAFGIFVNDRTLDQCCEPARFTNQAGVVSGDVDHAQTFTVGRAGVLTRVDVTVGRNELLASTARDLVVEIRPTASGLPTDEVLVSETVPAGTISVVPEPPPFVNPGFHRVDFSSPRPRVKVGEALAVVLRSPGGGGSPLGPYLWVGGQDDPCAGGHLAYRLGGDWTAVPDNDVGIRVFIESRFVRGDANADGDVNIADPIAVLNCLFRGGPCPTCRKAADANDDAAVNLTDSVYTLMFLFRGGAAPPSPFPSCGLGTGTLDCESFRPCLD